MHRDNIEGTNAHLARHVEVKLFFVQVRVFGHFEPVIISVSEVIAIVSGSFDHSLLLLQD